jgi:hypothetical protein
VLIKQLAEDLEHVLAVPWVAHHAQMRAFLLALPALKILQTASAKSVPLPKLQARWRLPNTYRISVSALAILSQ